jgi:hypothetical protein
MIGTITTLIEPWSRRSTLHEELDLVGWPMGRTLASP